MITLGFCIDVSHLTFIFKWNLRLWACPNPRIFGRSINIWQIEVGFAWEIDLFKYFHLMTLVNEHFHWCLTYCCYAYQLKNKLFENMHLMTFDNLDSILTYQDIRFSKMLFLCIGGRKYTFCTWWPWPDFDLPWCLKCFSGSSKVHFLKIRTPWPDFDLIWSLKCFFFYA